MLLRREEPAAKLGRRFGVSERVAPIIFRSRLCDLRRLSRKMVGVAEQLEDCVARGRMVRYSHSQTTDPRRTSFSTKCTRRPVSAGLVEQACDWPWSSTRHHELGKSVGTPLGRVF